MDAISHLLRMARVMAELDRRCLLGGSTRMDVAGRPPLQAQFHVLLGGRCQLQVGRVLLEMRPGDLVLIPSGSPHRVITPGAGPLRTTDETAGDSFITMHSADGGPAVIDLFCGHYSFDPGAGAVLFRSLPDPVHVSFGDSRETDEVLRMLSALMRGEARREGTGSAAILSALSTVLLAMVLRTTPNPSTAEALWTAASHPRVVAAIESVLDDPGADWSIERLARSAGMSRATFLRHFSQETGMNVGAFVTRARVMAAADLLGTSDATVATVAARVGYHSESAFSRAFRSEVGMTPARYRRDHRHRAQPAKGEAT
ncbi:AraC family transcriptional regulator [Streptomyces sp. NPDC050788]|uniref:AraC family transcriptional regulator n=1 Tax=Streptomyces sp. NPDC050788 TaxID=3155041 RepID=UPI003446079C